MTSSRIDLVERRLAAIERGLPGLLEPHKVTAGLLREIGNRLTEHQALILELIEILKAVAPQHVQAHAQALCLASRASTDSLAAFDRFFEGLSQGAGESPAGEEGGDG